MWVVNIQFNGIHCICVEKNSYINSFQNFSQHRQLIISKDVSFYTFSFLYQNKWEAYVLCQAPTWKKYCGNAVNSNSVGLWNRNENQPEFIRSILVCLLGWRTSKVFLVRFLCLPIWRQIDAQELCWIKLSSTATTDLCPLIRSFWLFPRALLSFPSLTSSFRNFRFGLQVSHN